MAEISVFINGRAYDIACDNGQEPRVRELAEYIDQKLQRVARGGGAQSESHLFALAMLLLADELFDARAQAAGQPQPATGEVLDSALSKADEQALARALSTIAKRIDGITSRLTQAA